MIIGIFASAILLTYLLVGWFYWEDQRELALRLITPPERLINSNIVAAIIAATIAELAGMTVLIVRFVFPPVVAPKS